jgi:lipoyl(octanoyl) transferase
MQRFTAARTADTPDELWLCEHPPVFTLGQAGKPEHLLRDIGIPAGEDRSRRPDHLPRPRPGGGLSAARPVAARPQGARIGEPHRAGGHRLLADGVQGERLAGAPGVYVGGAKIAALGLRVRGGCCYHGVALNVDMELAPFAAINPCGYAGMAVTQLRDLGADAAGWRGGRPELLEQLAKRQIEK